MIQTFSDKAECSKGICKPVTTAMFDNTDSTLIFEEVYASEQDAQQAFENLELKAKAVESEPCQIQYQILQEGTNFRLIGQFNFCCQAEAVLFQLSLR